MSHQIQPYLFFGGRCQEALDFYKQALGAEVDMVMHFDQSPEPMPEGMLSPGFEKKVMHSQFRIGKAVVLASDGCSTEEGGFHGVSLVLSVGDEAEANRLFDGLADGGNVTMPLSKTFWSPCYGMVTDRFGLHWQLMVPGENP